MRTVPIAAFGAVIVMVFGAATSVPPASPSATYTLAQARSGKMLFDANCARCHGASLTDGTAPNLAGSSFTASSLSFRALYTDITENMPLDNPGSLKHEQYAAIVAYILASNCYPPGTIAFPADGGVVNPKDKIGNQGAGKRCPIPALASPTR